MNENLIATPASAYRRPLESSKRARFELDADVFRGRVLTAHDVFVPDGLTLEARLPFLTGSERRLFGQIQGRTYANVFGLVERFIAAKVVELGRDHALGDQDALEALVRFSDEELKHQELFRRVEELAGRVMPAGYTTTFEPNAVANAVLSRSTWAVLALTCHIELFTLAHYKESLETSTAIAPLFLDVFKFHWREESQHAVLDELEWRRIDRTLSAAERDAAVDDFIALVGAVDGILQAQAAADANYFLAQLGRALGAPEATLARATFLAAYRHQYVFSGLARTRFPEILFGMIDAAQRARIESALATLA